jgi:uncharacterized sporulation protein YeaH/YhbH (DUF444 family)
MYKAEVDKARYRERLREAILARLPEVVLAPGFLLAPDADAPIRIRVPDLEMPFLRPARAGDGTGGRGQGGGGRPGDEAGEAVEVLVPRSEIEALLFEALALPRLEPKSHEEVATGEKHRGTVRRGPMPRLDRRRTMVEMLKAGVLSEDTLRFRDRRPVRTRVAKAVVVLVRDSSGSMAAEERRFLVRVATYWTVRWLRRTYEHVELRFVIHSVEAEEVDEERFFTRHLNGGTHISSGLLLAEEILRGYPADIWNAYLLAFSDSENFDADTPRVLATLERLLGGLAFAGYGHVNAGNGGQGFLRQLEHLAARYDHFRVGRIVRREDVGPWLQHMFGGEVA